MACTVQQVEEKGVSATMGVDIFPVGSRVRVSSYSPFRGLRGTVRTIHRIDPVPEDEKPFCFYRIALEGASLREAIWFECDEVELIALPSGVLQEQN